MTVEETEAQQMVFCPHTQSVGERGLESGLLNPAHLLFTNEAGLMGQ